MGDRCMVDEQTHKQSDRQTARQADGRTQTNRQLASKPASQPVRELTKQTAGQTFRPINKQTGSSDKPARKTEPDRQTDRRRSQPARYGRRIGVSAACVCCVCLLCGPAWCAVGLSLLCAAAVWVSYVGGACVSGSRGEVAGSAGGGVARWERSG